MTILVELGEKPKQGEAWLLELWKDLGGLIRKCNDRLKDVMARDWDRILYWLASAKPESARKVPMNVRLQLKTVDQWSDARATRNFTWDVKFNKTENSLT